MIPRVPLPPTWTAIEPGVYDDHAGGVHIVVPELLVSLGFRDTLRNRVHVLAIVRQVFGRAGVPLTTHEELES